MSVNHYENFPVASWLCPPRLRPAVAALYHFARTADDLADEGHEPPERRLAALAAYRRQLLRAWNEAQAPARDARQGTVPAPDSALQAAAIPGTEDTPPEPSWAPIFSRLTPVIRQHQLPLQPLLDLLDAFEQDVHNPPYPDRTALLDYCRRSANPVGRLLLHLWGLHDRPSQQQSDAICSALQLINFWQDFSIDHARGRCYIPQADARAHGLDPARVREAGDSPATQALVADLCAWAADMMRSGSPLPLRVAGRSGWELRLVVQGGLRILEKIERMNHRSLHRRPRLHAWDVPILLWRALCMGRATPPAPRGGAAS